MNLNSIMIGSEDPKGLAAYYTKLFGTPGFDDGGYQGWQIGTGYLMIGPHDQVKGPNAQPGRLMWNIETADVPGECKRLADAGAKIVQEPYHPGGDASEMWVATIADPEDNYFQLVSPMP